ncbi:MAG: MBL fold metallo-hydrolase [Oscillospiraceae bacterium]|nr:MBL fold metallo-hydrolase [Oscillospiraceae bacterium]
MSICFHPDLNCNGLPFQRIVNVGPVRGGEAFLMLGDRVSLLFDTGFGCGGDGLVENLERELDGRPLDFILLSHSHYDHAPGSAWATKRWPDCKVVAGEKTKSVFARPGALRTMRRLDRAASDKFNITAHEDLFDTLRVDLPLADRQTFQAGDESVTLLLLPGHTNCSVGFWFPSCGLLLTSESLGVYVDGSPFVISALLTGFEDGMNSIRRCLELPIHHMLIPHCGMIHGSHCRAFLENSLEMNLEIKKQLVAALEAGQDREALRARLKSILYHGPAAAIQPEEAFDENSGPIVDTIIREHMAAKE